jgi:hypothetical protein
MTAAPRWLRWYQSHLPEDRSMTTNALRLLPCGHGPDVHPRGDRQACFEESVIVAVETRFYKAQTELEDHVSSLLEDAIRETVREMQRREQPMAH